jgi:hypothetical protein
MAVAKPPNYSSYNRRKKPTIAKVTRGTFNVKPQPSPKPSARKPVPLKRPVAQPGTGGLAAPAPPKPVAQVVPSIGAGGAPVSLESQSDRIGARENYGIGMNTVNRNLMDAALRYGGVNQVQQFGYDSTGADTSMNLGVTASPEDNSALSVIARNAAAEGKNIDETAGTDNTFFSSRRLGDLQNVNNEADRQRISAKQEYDAAISDYINQLLGLRSSRDESLRGASIADIQAAMQNAPTNQIPQPTPAVRKPAPKSKPKAKPRKKK